MADKKIKLIVNADDLGLSEKINDGILLAHTKGIVTSASLVAQGEAFNHAVEIIKDNPTLDIGVHLTLVEENSLLNPDEIPSIVNEDGKFVIHAKAFVRKYTLGNISNDELQKELEAQIKKILNHGIKISHIDSHQHIHVLKDVFNIVLSLSKKYNIPVIRIPYEPIKPGMIFNTNLIRVASLKVLNFISNRRGKEILHTDNFAGFLYGGNLNSGNLLKILHNLPEGCICEIMCHPGLNDPNSKYSHWEYGWETELNSLTNPDIKRFINEKGIELINFSDFSNSYPSGVLS